MTLDFATMLAALALCLAAASPPVTDALQKCRVLSRLREAAVRLIERRFLFLGALLLLLAFALRTYRLTTYPTPLSADEAFIAASARWLTATGRDLNGSLLPPYLKGAGSLGSMGILTPLLTAPFVSVFGMSALAVRLPALLMAMGCLVLMAAWVYRVCGKGGALLALFMGALAPWAFMSARFGTAAHAFLFFLMLGVYWLAASQDCTKKSLFFLYGGAAALAASMYTVDVSWIAVPVFMIGYTVYSLVKQRSNPVHILGAAGMFLLLSLPSFCVAAVNLFGLNPFQFLFMRIEHFDLPSSFVHSALGSGGVEAVGSALRQNFISWIGWLTLNIHTDEFTPSGVWTPWNQASAYAFLIPFLLVGSCVLVSALQSKKHGAGMPLALLGMSFVLQLLFPSMDSQEFLFAHAAVTIVSCIGLFETVRRVRLSGIAAIALLVLTAFPLITGYFGEDYMASTGDQYHPGLVESIQYAKELAPDDVVLSQEIHPSSAPHQTARAYGIYALNERPQDESLLTIAYFPGLTPDTSGRTAYVGRYSDFDTFDYAVFNYAEFEDYCVLTPIAAFGEMEP